MFARILLIGALLFLSACAQQMTREDYTAMKNLAVVNDIKDELAFYNRGMTVFGNALTRVDITPWKLSHYLTEQTIAAASKEHPGISIKEVVIEKGSLTRNEILPAELIEKLKAQGFDTVLIIQNGGIYKAAGGGSYLASPEIGGFIFYGTSVLGETWKHQLFPQFYLSLYRLSDLKNLGYASNSSTFPPTLKNLSTKAFDQYTDAEKEIIRKELVKNMDATIAPNVTKLFTVKE